MRSRGLTIRQAVVGAGVALAVSLGAAACGSTSKSNTPATPVQVPAAATHTPTTTTPPTTVSSGGGVSY